MLGSAHRGSQSLVTPSQPLNKLAGSLLYLAETSGPIIVDLTSPLPLELLQKFLHRGEGLSSSLQTYEVAL